MDNRLLRNRITGENFVIRILAAAVFVFGNSRVPGGRGRSNDIFATVRGGFPFGCFCMEPFCCLNG